VEGAFKMQNAECRTSPFRLRLYRRHFPLKGTAFFNAEFTPSESRIPSLIKLYPSVSEIELSVLLPYFPHYFAGVSHSHNVCRYVLGYNTSCTDDGIISDCNTGHNKNTCTKPAIFADCYAHIILIAQLPYFGKNGVPCCCHNNIGAEHGIITHIDVSIVNEGKPEVCIYILRVTGVIRTRFLRGGFPSTHR